MSTSPKGMDTFRCLDERTVGYLDLTGSGNETAAHVEADGRVTLMFCSFAEVPLILRVYGRGRVVRPRDDAWRDLFPRFFGLDDSFLPGARQIIVVSVESTQSSCGHGVPRYDFVAERDNMPKWLTRKGEAGMDAYRRQKNQESIDGFPTGLFE